MEQLTRYEKFLDLSESYTFWPFWKYFVRCLFHYNFRVPTLIDNEYKAKQEFINVIEAKLGEIQIPSDNK